MKLACVRKTGYAPLVHAADKVSKVREIRTLLARGAPREQLDELPPPSER